MSGCRPDVRIRARARHPLSPCGTMRPALARIFQRNAQSMRQARRPPTREVVTRFPGASELVRDAEALSYHALLVACFVLLCADVLPPAAFMVIGLCCYVRNFQALHEACHTRRMRDNPLRRFRTAGMIVNSPLQFGRDQLVR